MPVDTIIAKFHERTRVHPQRPALTYKANGEWQDITWGDYGDLVRRAGKALIALGYKHGNKIAILSNNRPEWHVADVASMALGGASAAIYQTSSPEQVQYIVEHSESKFVFVDSSDQLEKMLKIKAEVPKVKKVIIFGDYDGGANGNFVITWDDFQKLGDDVEDARYEEAVASVKPEDLATFVYTSGTTGPPKAVMLTHANIWWTCNSTQAHIPIGSDELKNADGSYNARAISYLPLSHIAERMLGHLLHIFYGHQTCFAESIDKLVPNLQEIKPTYFFGVPRVWEKFYAGVQAKMAAADPNDRKAKLAKRAIEVGKEVTELQQEAVRRGGKMADARIPIGLKVRHSLLDKLVLHKIRAAFGLEECRLPLSAAAPLAPELIWFFHSIGLPIAEGYGQSEGNGPTSWNPPDAVNIGSVGLPFPGMEVKVAEDGEILVRGGNIMAGYYKDKKASAETVDKDGWLHSGDVGEFNEHGYLKITDRKKDLIITAGGKNIAPQEIENKIKQAHPAISQVVVIGDRRPFLTAIVTLDEEKAPAWAKKAGIDGGDGLAGIANDDRALKEIYGAIAKVNKALAKVEGIKKIRILERDFLQDENEITPTFKVKRKQINELYADVIEGMYKKDSPEVAGAKAPLRK
ncbi:MAG: long-chain fatty acid--CoA ligase [Actinomycetota bacterium]